MISIVRRNACHSKLFVSRSLSVKKDSFVFDNVSTSEGSVSKSSFRVPEGSKVALLGSNVQAKDDILKLLTGDVKASAGNVVLPPSQHVVGFSPHISKDLHIYSVKAFLEKSLNPTDLKNSSSIIHKVLEDVKLGARLERRIVSTLNFSQHARLQFAAALLQSPDVLLLDQPTVTSAGSLSPEDARDLSDFLRNFPRTCVVNSTDEDFLNSFIDIVLHVGTDGSVEKLNGTYSDAKKVIELRARAALSASIEEKFRANPVQKEENTYASFAAAEAELEKLNQIGFSNEKRSDEASIVLMMVVMIFHPALVYGLFQGGMLDAIL